MKINKLADTRYCQIKVNLQPFDYERVRHAAFAEHLSLAAWTRKVFEAALAQRNADKLE